MKKIKEVVVLQDEGGKFSFNKIIFILLIFAILLYFVLNTNISFFLDINKFINPYIGFFEKLLVVLIILLLTYLFLNVSKKLLKGYLTRSGRSKRNIKLFLTIYEYFVWFVAIILTFSIVLKQGASLITSIGLIGFGLTLALQKPISEFRGMACNYF
ncbi:MAG: hypothetical protein KatS3mg001_318 [Candidatus Pacearchaeota archaeon]|nr:MAG: hypothetical protein KatS3mg001_318 [Candidatus Pacearchaeota archaeon]